MEVVPVDTADKEPRYPYLETTPNRVVIPHSDDPSEAQLRNGIVPNEIEMAMDSTIETDDVLLSQDIHASRRRKKCIVIWLLLALGIGAVVALVVSLTTRKSSSSSSATTGSEPPPGLVTLVLQLDEAPEETGWTISCQSQNMLTVPAGFYQDPNTEIRVLVPVAEGEICVLNVFDEGGDGIANGYLEVYYGAVAMNESKPGKRFLSTAADTPILVIPGNFFFEARGIFTVGPPGSNGNQGTAVPGAHETFSPSIVAPTGAPTTLSPSRVGDTLQPTQTSTLIPTVESSPSSGAPTKASQNPVATNAPFPSPSPTSSSSQKDVPTKLPTPTKPPVRPTTIPTFLLSSIPAPSSTLGPTPVPTEEQTTAPPTLPPTPPTTPVPTQEQTTAPPTLPPTPPTQEIDTSVPTLSPTTFSPTPETTTPSPTLNPTPLPTQEPTEEPPLTYSPTVSANAAFVLLKFQNERSGLCLSWREGSGGSQFTIETGLSCYTEDSALWQFHVPQDDLYSDVGWIGVLLDDGSYKCLSLVDPETTQRNYELKLEDCNDHSDVQFWELTATAMSGLFQIRNIEVQKCLDFCVTCNTPKLTASKCKSTNIDQMFTPASSIPPPLSLKFQNERSGSCLAWDNIDYGYSDLQYRIEADAECSNNDRNVWEFRVDNLLSNLGWLRTKTDDGKYKCIYAFDPGAYDPRWFAADLTACRVLDSHFWSLEPTEHIGKFLIRNKEMDMCLDYCVNCPVSTVTVVKCNSDNIDQLFVFDIVSP